MLLQPLTNTPTTSTASTTSQDPTPSTSLRPRNPLPNNLRRLSMKLRRKLNHMDTLMIDQNTHIPPKTMLTTEIIRETLPHTPMGTHMILRLSLLSLLKLCITNLLPKRLKSLSTLFLLWISNSIASRTT